MSGIRITITNTSLRNGGDAAIVEAMTQTISDAFDDADLSYDDIDPASVSSRFPSWRIGPYRVSANRWNRPEVARPVLSIASMMASIVGSIWCGRRRDTLPDLVISAGGTYLNNKYFALDKLANIWLAQREGSATVIFTQTVSVLDRRLDRQLARRVFEAADLVLLRDDRSLANLEAMGIDCRKVHVVADAVFALAEPERWRRSSPRRIDEVGISVRDCTLFQSMPDGEVQYRAAIASLCSSLVREHGARIRFVSTCQGIDDYRYDDSTVAESIVELLDDEVRAFVTIDHDFHRPEEFRSILARLDLLVSTRMHGAIQALAVGTPVVPIAYESKTTELWAGFGLQEFCVELQRCRDDLLPMVEQAIAGIDVYCKALAQGTAEAHASTTAVASMLRAVIR